MKRQIIIFDFDGTLADVLPHFRLIYDQLSPKYNLRQIDDKDYHMLRKKSVWQVMRWTGVRPWQLNGILRDGRRIFATHKDKVELFEGMPELIRQLYDDGHKIYILSSNRERTIRLILERYSLKDEVIVMKRPWFFGKAGRIKKLIKNMNYDRSQVWMVGDETRDAAAGNRAGINTISVTWGLQAREALQAKNPTKIASSVKQLTNIFNDLS